MGKVVNQASFTAPSLVGLARSIGGETLGLTVVFFFFTPWITRHVAAGEKDLSGQVVSH